MKKLLIAGGGYADIPLIKAAKRLGYFVITSGNRPDDMGHPFADKVSLADFSDAEAILSVAKENKVDGICPCCNDFSALSAAYAAEKLGLPGHDTFEVTRLLHHKDLYRNFAREHQIPSPQAHAFGSEEEAIAKLETLTFPVMVKPVDLTGGKGIAVVESIPEGKRAILDAFSISKAKRIVLEEFVAGTRHGFTAILSKGSVVFHLVDDEYYHLNQYMVSAASTPGTVSADIAVELIGVSEKIAGLLNLVDGIFHVQFIVKEKKPYIIEICRRPPGDLYIELVRYATGFDYATCLIRCFSGEAATWVKQLPVQRNFLRHCVMTNRNGVFKRLKIDAAIKESIVDIIPLLHDGDSVDNYLVQKAAITFHTFPTVAELRQKSKDMQGLIQMEMY